MYRKVFILLFLIAISLSSSYSQLKEKDGLLGPSLGFWTSPGALTFGLNYESQLTQLGDVALLSLGGVFRYTSFRDAYFTEDNPNTSYITLGLQSNVNFNQIGDGRFVPFVGLVLGYNNISNSYVNRNGTINTRSYNSGLWLWGQAGMRYFFSPKVAGALRIGAGNYNFNVVELGIDFKL